MQELYRHSVVKWHEVAQTLAMEDFVRKMSAKLSAKYGEDGLFGNLLFLIVFGFHCGSFVCSVLYISCGSSCTGAFPQQRQEVVGVFVTNQFVSDIFVILFCPLNWTKTVQFYHSKKFCEFWTVLSCCIFKATIHEWLSETEVLDHAPLCWSVLLSPYGTYS